MVTYNGASVNARTKAMLAEAEKLSGVPLTVTQGRNPGGVAASAGTHDGWGVVDLRAITHTASQRKQVVLAGRKVGFAIWLRTPDQSDWPWHYHAVAIGDPGLSYAARNQVASYRNGRNGLASNGKDDGPPGYTDVTWEKYLASKPTPGEDEEMTPAQQKYLDDRMSEYSKWLLYRLSRNELLAAKARGANAAEVKQREADTTSAYNDWQKDVSTRNV